MKMIPFLSPPFALTLLLATINALLSYLLWGKRRWELGIYWVAALLGFILGHLGADVLGFSFLTIGPLHLVEGTIASWVSLFIAKRLKV